VGEQMDFPRLRYLNRHWEKTPPLPISVAGIAAFLGVKFGRAPGSGTGPVAAVPPDQIAGEVLDMLLGDSSSQRVPDSSLLTPHG